jgi:hypothetical protein
VLTGTLTHFKGSTYLSLIFFRNPGNAVSAPVPTVNFVRVVAIKVMANIRNTQRINAVITGGRIYRRPSLDKMLEFAEAHARS